MRRLILEILGIVPCAACSVLIVRGADGALISVIDGHIATLCFACARRQQELADAQETTRRGILVIVKRLQQGPWN